ncbi:flagellar hook protein FlgE [Clostridium acetobutylicum]|uniref:Flagellar hook protein FlgE n=1 Tax=Clostridium acetobutylicum (strain ATCC 824 / DSM 792 / JCM 1419 / IAM 19013 / LMG 5710 / NBRC 13948 / NRRL B-527 / VKM B-1787 / 2291 / W) TaxID=272562 RepID=Q97H59_CLOAB|nr:MULTISPECIES: flagellar hook-basal body complex protein [Clostridium]AAK80112.1 Flagellar hook protein FlgE [Clostridium acetobutylicum ATCC 824]ADZ21205.1 Flagellar hook protein FlgE [Clostridium acetobutylicum EA 2018]AEI34493.1 flagellar hook protein FlgE [Clostridium acetobutylicum DSM 1731]AWV79463.1 flagellar hook protein FlgE [Clostridium acetobutylicum]MBC2394566.1 flagellar hook protein FlgE [Clostridium acetobutylicum]
MLRAMTSGISGLKVNQNKLDIVGSNIANSSTTAYKSQSINFSDAISETIKGASGATANYGGVNPEQITLGVNSSAIITNTASGSVNTTGRNLDVAITDGDGYFMVASGANMADESECINVSTTDHSITSTPSGTDISYTRDGSFNLDNEGNLVTADGRKVLGYSMVGRNTLYEDSADKTKNIYGNFVSISGAQDETTMAGSDENAATYIAAEGGDDLNKSIVAAVDKNPSGSGTATIKKGDVAFVDANDVDLRADNRYLHTLKIPPTVTKVTATRDASGNAVYSTQELKVKGFSIGQDGVITANLDNGSAAAIGQIAMSSFTNAGGLEKEGGNYVKPSASSGQPMVRSGAYSNKLDPTFISSAKKEDNSGGYGKMYSGALEMSNVDLAQQFSDMIVASRAYQANGKIITTSDEILQDLVNLKR